MPRKPDSGQLDLAEVFRRVQVQMLSELAVGSMFEHASSAGAATEHNWIHLFERYLPKRYRAAPAFVIDCDGRRSKQIDIAIFDNLYSPPLFPHDAGLHIPAESVYAVFEVKPTISKQFLRDAAQKAASVRTLRRTSAPVYSRGAACGLTARGLTVTARRTAIKPQPILAGLLATSSVWSAETFDANLRNALNPPASPLLHHLSSLLADYRLDLGCSLAHGAFELLDIPSPRFPTPHIQISDADESLIYFMLRLFERLRDLGTAPAADLMEYGRSLHSFQRVGPRK